MDTLQRTIDSVEAAVTRNGKYKIEYQTDLVQSKTSKGLDKFWQGFSLSLPSGEVYIGTAAFQQTKEGYSKINVSDPKEIFGKNLTKSNATTPVSQSLAEVKALATKKHDEGYRLPGEIDTAEVTLALPMLAHEFGKRGKDVKYPAATQPKLDGVRALTDGSQMWSRLGKPFDQQVVEHIITDLKIPEGVILDGELMLRDTTLPFESIISAVKKYKPDLSPTLVYHVYDIVDDKKTFIQRTQDLQAIVSANSDNPAIEMVMFTLVTDEEQVLASQSSYESAGYEGAMIRNIDSLYKIGHRSVDLLKLKSFVDDEYEIVSYEEGRGRFVGTPVFYALSHHDQTRYVAAKKRINSGKLTSDAIRELNDGEREALGIFSVTPDGPLDIRQALFKEVDTFIGKNITIQYQNLTAKDIPRFPVGKNIDQIDR